MKVRRALGYIGLIGSSLLLAGCGGGGGGGITSTPPPPTSGTPTPSPSPAPTSNSSLVDLVASQNFTNEAVANETIFDRSNIAQQIVGGGKTDLQISYDAKSKSYTLSTGTISQTFTAGNVQSDGDPFFTNYTKTGSDYTDYLSLSRPGPSGNFHYQYVGAGYWQRNTDSTDSYHLLFNAFTYGLPTPTDAVPRSGSGSYAIDLFGFFTALSSAGTKAIEGTGQLNADFARGLLNLAGTAQQYDVSSYTPDGREYAFDGTAEISSNGTFSGGFFYNGPSNYLTGGLDGRFYGPHGEEVGATFSAQDEYGDGEFQGTITGRLDDTLVPQNTLLTDLVTDQQFDTLQTELNAVLHGSLNYQKDGSYRLNYAPADDSFVSPTFTAADKVASLSDSRFTVYRKTENGTDYQLKLYKPGAGNAELALSYASFGNWSIVGGKQLYPDSLTGPFESNRFFVYGEKTPPGVLARSGSASYAGLVFGTAVNAGSGESWDITGSSSIGIDFSQMSVEGTLKMSGLDAANGAILAVPDLNLDGFFDRIGNNFTASASSTDGRITNGQFAGQLYGPQGQELGGAFAAALYNGIGSVPTNIVGVTVGKRQ